MEGGGGGGKELRSCSRVLARNTDTKSRQQQAAEQTLEWCCWRGEVSAAAVGLQHKNAVDELKFLWEKVGNNVVAAT